MLIQLIASADLSMCPHVYVHLSNRPSVFCCFLLTGVPAGGWEAGAQLASQGLVLEVKDWA